MNSTAQQLFLALGVLLLGAATLDAQERKTDVWDFGGVEAPGSHVVNHLSRATLDGLEAVTAGKFAGGSWVFDDLTLNTVANDRLYYFDEAGNPGKRGYGAQGYAAFDFGDGYVSNGLFYCNGTGGEGRRYLLLSNVQAGDRITFYARNSNSANDVVHFAHVVDGVKSGQQDEAAPITVEAKAYVSVARASGTYKIYTEANAGKPVYYRVSRVPGVRVSGVLTGAADQLPPGSGLKLVNQGNQQVTLATLGPRGQWTAVLAPGFRYTATLTGAVGWAVAGDTKVVDVAAADGVTGVRTGVTLAVAAQKTYRVQGRLVGLGERSASGLTLTFVPAAGSNAEPVVAALSEAPLGFRATLEPGLTYTARLAGANDYQLSQGGTWAEEQDQSRDLVFAPLPTWDVTGTLDNLTGPAPALQFVRVDDASSYPGQASGTSYRARLRDGVYDVKLTSGAWTTSAHVVVAGGAVVKNLRLRPVQPVVPALPLVHDLYVGTTTKAPRFATVTQALAAAAAMGPRSEQDRITIHLAPGVYREQVQIRVPYLSLVNDNPSQEAKLTWYYGIGYRYFSAGPDGYYSEDAAADRFERRTVARWGAATSVFPTATAFRAQGVTFETSFSKYVTDEELADGVTSDGSVTFVRKLTADVASRAAIERSAALAVEGDFAEFVGCRIIGSQDTLFTGTGIHAYFRQCFIEGNTDYIFGDGDCVFDLCELQWCGYSDTASGGYLTAAKDTAPQGYLFRNCFVSAKADRAQAPGFWGRPWGAGARVLFWKTALESPDRIAPAGWTAMSGNAPEKARFREFGTTWNGQPVDPKGRVVGPETVEPSVDAWFGAWKPVSLVQPTPGPGPVVQGPSLTSSDDLNTPYPGHVLTVHYALASGADASLVQWYRVPKAGAPVLAAVSAGMGSKAYRVSADDVGCTLRAVVTPVAWGGPAGSPVQVETEAAVRPGVVAKAGVGPVETGLRVPGKVNVFLAGDSTVKDYSAFGLYNNQRARDEGSWGEFLASFFDPARVAVVNYANGGRSTRNFLNEGSLDKIAAQIGPGDFLLIQFGHNDAANQSGYLEDRHVPLGVPDAQGRFPTVAGTKVPSPGSYAARYGDTFYAWDSGGTQKWFLLRYIDVARKAGATPILVTPVSRQYFDAQGRIRPHHDANDPASRSPVTTNNAYVRVVEQLGQEQNVAVLDAYGLTKTLYEDAWTAANGSNRLALHLMFPGDSTHSNKLGGFLSAALVARALKATQPALAPWVVKPTRVLGETTSGQVLFTVKTTGEFEAQDEAWTQKGRELLKGF